MVEQKHANAWRIVTGVLIFCAGMYVRERMLNTPTSVMTQQNVLDTLAEIVQHPVCITPLLIMTVTGVLVSLPYLTRAFAEVVVYILRARVELDEIKMHVEQTRKQVLAPQLLRDEQGRQVLVSPTLVTRPITAVDAEADLDSEQLRAARILAEALKAAGDGRYGRPSPELLALAWGGTQMIPPEQRMPPEVRILTDDEVKTLDSP